jgi:hypothetical protein
MAHRVAEQIPERRLERADINNGPAAAAFLAAGIGSLALGVATTLAEASAAIGSALNLYRPVGPLSGKTVVALAVWLVSWVILHFAWRNKQLNFQTIFITTLVLIALGFLGTFPIFFGMFAQE